MEEKGTTTRFERARHVARIASRVHGGCFCIHKIITTPDGEVDVCRYDWGRTAESECLGALEAVYVDGYESGLTPGVRLQHDGAPGAGESS